jgi:hypothetical protein
MLKWSLVRRIHSNKKSSEVVLFTSYRSEEVEAVMLKEVASWCLKNPSETFEVVYNSSKDIAFFVDSSDLVVFDTRLEIED